MSNMSNYILIMVWYAKLYSIIFYKTSFKVLNDVSLFDATLYCVIMLWEYTMFKNNEVIRYHLALHYVLSYHINISSGNSWSTKDDEVRESAWWSAESSCKFCWGDRLSCEL